MSKFRIYDAVLPNSSLECLSDSEKCMTEQFVIRGLPRKLISAAKVFFFESDGTIEDAAKILQASVTYAQKQYKDCLYQLRRDLKIRRCLLNGITVYRKEILSESSKQHVIECLKPDSYKLSWVPDIDNFIIADEYGKDPRARATITLDLPTSIIYNLLKHRLFSVQQILDGGEQELAKVRGIGAANRNLIRQALSNDGYDVRPLGEVSAKNSSDYTKERNVEVMSKLIDEAFEHIWGSNRPSNRVMNLTAQFLYENGVRITEQAHKHVEYGVTEEVHI